MSDIKIDCLTRKLAEVDQSWDANCGDHSPNYHVKRGDCNGDKHISLRESEAILITKRLQERVF